MKSGWLELLKLLARASSEGEDEDEDEDANATLDARFVVCTNNLS